MWKRGARAGNLPHQKSAVVGLVSGSYKTLHPAYQSERRRPAVSFASLVTGWVRMVSITWGLSTQSMTLTGPVLCSHTMISMFKTRLRSQAQVITRYCSPDTETKGTVSILTGTNPDIFPGRYSADLTLTQREAVKFPL